MNKEKLSKSFKLLEKILELQKEIDLVNDKSIHICVVINNQFRELEFLYDHLDKFREQTIRILEAEYLEHSRNFEVCIGLKEENHG
jgi:hypothetical protein